VLSCGEEVVHELARISTNWRLVCSALLFKTGAVFVIGEKMGVSAGVSSGSIARFALLKNGLRVKCYVLR